MNRIEALKASLEKKPELREHLFVRGFLLTDDEIIDFEKFPFYGTWKIEKLGKYKAYGENCCCFLCLPDPLPRRSRLRLTCQAHQAGGAWMIMARSKFAISHLAPVLSFA